MGGITQDGEYVLDEHEVFTLTAGERTQVKNALLALVGAMDREVRQHDSIAELDADVIYLCLRAAQMLITEF